MGRRFHESSEYDDIEFIITNIKGYEKDVDVGMIACLKKNLDDLFGGIL